MFIKNDTQKYYLDMIKKLFFRGKKMKKIVDFLKSKLQSKPLQNIIVFESVPDLSDNTKAVFDEFIRRGFNKRYKLVWLIEKDKKNYPKYKNVVYLKNNLHKTFFSKISRLRLGFLAKCFISCNRCLTSQREDQVAFYLSHGTPIKSVRDFYGVPTSIDYALVASKNVEKLYAYEKHIDERKMVGLGYPRNDELLNNPVDIKRILKTDCDKILVWYPTYRQNKNKNGIKTNSSALPIIHNESSALELNEWAREKNALIVMKPHFAQDVTCIKDLNLSNIRFINDEFFIDNKISSYTFIGNCDALITDYSSVYYDFTLCDKPIAVIWEDIEEYKKCPGFAVDLDTYLKGAEKIYTLMEFKQFISRVCNGIDLLKKERNEVKDFVNFSSDGRNSSRVVDFIIEKAKL